MSSSSLARHYSVTSQRHLTVTAIRERMGWSDPTCRGYWQDLRDSAQEFRLRHFRDQRWGEIPETEKKRLCASFVAESPHRDLIRREEQLENQEFISWWLLANTRPVNASPESVPLATPPQTPRTSPSSSGRTREYYDPVREGRVKS